MSQRFLSVVFVFFVGLQIVSIFARIDSWPLTDYPMFPGVMKADDVMIFRVIARLQDNSAIELPHTGWPSMPNYSDRFMAKDWVGLRDQVMIDYYMAQKSDRRLEIHQIKNLTLLRLGQKLGEKQLKKLGNFELVVQPASKKFQVQDD